MRISILLVFLLAFSPDLSHAEYSIHEEIDEKTNIRRVWTESGGKLGVIGLECRMKWNSSSLRITFINSGRLPGRPTFKFQVDSNNPFNALDVKTVGTFFGYIEVKDDSTRDLLEQMKAGNSIEVNVYGWQNYRFSASLIGFTKASKKVLAACGY